MEEHLAIKVDNLSKVYPLRQSTTDKNGNIINEHWALKDVTFEIKKGESVGIIGPNGSGKSTLLKILAGVIKPTDGSAKIRGKVASILDIGAGFHPELSGRENVFLNGQIHGFSKKEIAARFDEIVSFSGIEKFIEEPVKNYSNGMYLRLAFSIMSHLDFDVYLFDEVLSVGDLEFRLKCIEKIKYLIKKKNKTILVISHNFSELSYTVDSVIVGKKGVFEAAKNFTDAMLHYENQHELSALPDFIEQLTISLKDRLGNEKSTFTNDEEIVVEIYNKFKNKELNYLFGIYLLDQVGEVVLTTSPIQSHEGIVEIDFNHHQHFKYFFPAYLLNEGLFKIGLVYFNEKETIGEVNRVSTFQVRMHEKYKQINKFGRRGPLKLIQKWEILKEDIDVSFGL